MLLFKYFEKRAKDGFPNPNGLLSSRVPSDESVGQPKGIWGITSLTLPDPRHFFKVMLKNIPVKIFSWVPLTHKN